MLSSGGVAISSSPSITSPLVYNKIQVSGPYLQERSWFGGLVVEGYQHVEFQPCEVVEDVMDIRRQVFLRLRHGLVRIQDPARWPFLIAREPFHSMTPPMNANIMTLKLSMTCGLVWVCRSGPTPPDPGLLPHADSYILFAIDIPAIYLTVTRVFHSALKLG